MNLIVVYPGRFHPFHRGHKASYDYLTKQFGADNVYIATSNVQAPLTSPFTYADKVEMMTKLGIPAGHVVQVKNPYQVKEITDSLPDPENTALVYAISEKDMQGDAARFKFGTKKNGEPSYMQPMPENLKQLKPMTKHAYVTVTPTVNFKVKGADANSASEVRKIYIAGNDTDRANIIADLYGEVDPDLQTMFNQRLGVTQKVSEIYYEARRNKNLSVLERLLVLEKKANNQHQVLQEDLVADANYLDEKISR
jgi:hypothetical protein